MLLLGIWYDLSDEKEESVNDSLAKTHTQHLLEGIAYNLYRAPRIIMSTAQK